MPARLRLSEAYHHLKISHRALYQLALVVLFWTIFDDIMSYLAPLIMTQRGLSDSMMGIIYSSSSVAGALFDYVMSRWVKRTTFRRILLVMFALCALYPLLLWQAKTIWLMVFAMVWWGVYFDLYSYAAFDFVGRYEQEEKHAASFGVLQVFRALGGILAPLLVGLVVLDRVDFKPFALAWVFLGIGAIFLVLLLLHRQRAVIHRQLEPRPPRRSFHELAIWRKVGRTLFPVLSLTFFLYVMEAFFWTLAPLYSEQLKLRTFGGLLLAAYTLPAIFVGWYVGRLTKRWGKKRTAFIALMLGSGIVALFGVIHTPYLLVGAAFIASCFISLSQPSIEGAYANYVAETPDAEREIEALQDFMVNLGYVVGPLIAGFLAQAIRIPAAFSALGVIGVVVALVLLKFTPRSITVSLPPPIE